MAADNNVGQTFNATSVGSIPALENELFSFCYFAKNIKRGVDLRAQDAMPPKISRCTDLF